MKQITYKIAIFMLFRNIYFVFQNYKYFKIKLNEFEISIIIYDFVRIINISRAHLYFTNYNDNYIL